MVFTVEWQPGDPIRLTSKEIALIDLLRSETYQQRSEAQLTLMQSLKDRKAIPTERWRVLTDPELEIDGRFRNSAFCRFLKNNGGDEERVFRHPGFKKWIDYLVNGPDLPSSIIVEFRKRVASCGNVTSGDLPMLERLAKDWTRNHRLNPEVAGEAFYRLALEYGNLQFVMHEARRIRDAVRKMNRISSAPWRQRVPTYEIWA